MRVPRESGSRAERPLGRAKGEGRFGGCAVNGLAARGAPLNAQRGPDFRVNKVVPRNRPALWVCFAFLFLEGRWSALKHSGINVVALLLVLVCIFALLGLPGSGKIGFDASRINPAGLVILLAGLVAEFCAGPIARKLRPDAQDGMRNAVKLIALAVCAVGALLVML